MRLLIEIESTRATLARWVDPNQSMEEKMQNTFAKLRPAQAEIHRTAHDQDLIEVPKRAKLDRENETQKDQQQATVHTVC